MTNHCPLGPREQSLLDGSAGQGEAGRARERCNGHVSQGCPPVSFSLFEQILCSLLQVATLFPYFLQLEYYVLVFRYSLAARVPH